MEKLAGIDPLRRLFDRSLQSTRIYPKFSSHSYTDIIFMGREVES